MYEPGYPDPVTVQSTDTKLNLIQFPNENIDRTIEWHKDTFKEVILVQEFNEVKWVIGFTIHTKNRTILQSEPNFKFVKSEKPHNMNLGIYGVYTKIHGKSNY